MIEPKTILLVMENPDDADLALAALSEQRLACSVEIARNGREALNFLRREGKYALRSNGDPVAVILDLKQPEMDGLEVIRRIRNDDKMKLIPIVAFTSSPDRCDMRECYENKVNSYVAKPSNHRDFIDVVTRLCMYWAFLNEPPA